ncbi:MAG TPA: thioredoxin domain-containing protein [Gemmatimonadaceae bacterium]|nr:thioredoxin domain-containing protein [Gemmatimonadaceae bacterium]
MTHGSLTPAVRECDHAIGPADAPVTLVEYGDYECPYCGMAHPIVQAVRRALGDRLRFVFRNFPLAEIHPHAVHAAEAAEAAGAQGKFWEMHDLIFEHQRALDDGALARYAEQIGLDAERFARDLTATSIERRVRDDFMSGVRSGVNGTPTFFINGQRWDGPWTDVDAFIAAVAAAEARPGQPVHAGRIDDRD